jgi:hypothetical protein
MIKDLIKLLLTFIGEIRADMIKRELSVKEQTPRTLGTKIRRY